MCMKGCEAAKQQQCYYTLHCLGGERLTPKVLDHLLAPRSGHATAIIFFTHLLIVEDADNHQI